MTRERVAGVGGVGFEHAPAAARLEDHDADRVRDHVVELARDPRPLLHDRGRGPPLLLLELSVVQAPLPDRSTRGPRGTQEQRVEDDGVRADARAVRRERRDVEADDHPAGDHRAAAARVRGSAVDGEQIEDEHGRVGGLGEHRHRERPYGDGEDQAEQRKRVTGPSRRRRPEGDRQGGRGDPMRFRCFGQRDPEQGECGERGSQHLVAASVDEGHELVPAHRATRYGMGVPDSITRESDPPSRNLALASERGSAARATTCRGPAPNVESSATNRASRQREDCMMRRPITAAFLGIVASLAIASSALGHECVNASKSDQAAGRRP